MVKIETKIIYFFDEEKLKRWYNDYIEGNEENIPFEEWVKYYAEEENLFWDCVFENKVVEKITYNVEPF